MIQNILRITMERPSSYGWFHFASTIVIILLTVLFAFKAKKDNDKSLRNTIFISWLIMFIFELYKQYLLNYNDETKEVIYQWYSFPYQFCSAPLFLLPFVAFLKEGKVRDSIIGFLMFFCFFAGLSVYVYPEGVFTIYLGLNIQTMLHHGLQIVLGVYLIVYYKNKINLKFFLKSLFTLATLVIIAVILNEVLYEITNHEYINLFYISRHFECALPILPIIQKAIPWYLFILVYFIGMSLCGFLIYCITLITMKIVNKQGKINKY